MVAPHQQVTGNAEKYYTPTDSVGNVAPDNVIAGDQTATNSDDDLEKGANGSYDDSDPNNHGGIDVNYAKHEFEGLRRRYSNLSRTASQHSQASHRASRQWSRRSQRDIEEADEDDSESQFDVEGVLRGRKKQMDEEEFRPKNIGVVFEDLSVYGMGGVKHFVKTFPDAFVDFVNIYGTIAGLFGKKSGTETAILHNFNGIVKPGEMLLVLGQPDSGCTTCLRTLANQRSGYTRIEGDVTYGGIDTHTFAKYFRGEAVYNQEDDVHHPTLKVGQILSFAIDTKTPRRRVTGMSVKDFNEDVITTLLKMFNMEHTRNTMAGGVAGIRGVSGGERKRISIAEMMITRSSVACWDNTTRGLDASTALDFAKCLRILTDVYQLPNIVSLYQASENIYKLFDKVMVIHEGKQIYFGPTSKARAYFEGLGYEPKPRQTTPDYLTGCTDEFERDIAEGQDPEKVPTTADAMAEAYKASSIQQDVLAEIKAYKEELANNAKPREEFVAAVAEQKRKHTPHKSVYSIPFYRQVIALQKRQFQLKIQDWFTLTTALTTQIVCAVLVGTLFMNLPLTSDGAFTRGGVIFISLLFSSLQAFSEMGSTMMGRPIVNKHQAFAFHRPAALWVAQIFVDLPFAMTNIMCYSLIAYFSTGLYRTAGAFFTFYLYIVVGYVVMALFFRSVGVVCPDFDYAMKFAAVILTFFVLSSGYLLPYNFIPWWIRWTFWINPVSYGFSAMMDNEFKRINLTCAPANLVPSGPGYTNLANQVCTLAGSVTGSDLVIGSEYITQQYNYRPSEQWRNFGILIVFGAFFMFLNCLLSEVVLWGASGRTVTFFQKENKDRKALNDELKRKKHQRKLDKSVQDKQAQQLKITSKKVLTWENLNYDVPVGGGKQLRLLNNIFGFVKPGQLTALMGASGAGKTTLLDVLANRKNIGVITGDVLIDSQPRGIEFQRGTAYCEQLDVHEGTQTVREALRFSAYLRQPHEVPKAEKDAYVEEVISLLEMEDIADAIIGDPTVGLPVADRKRVTIGVELAAKPQLLLFLDEPTSGLDSQSAFNIVRFLKKLAGAGQAILCTIHQPNASLFENFDRLLLLERGGRTVYFGEIGEDARVLREYFRKNGAECPRDANPAEFMLEAIGAGSAARIGEKDWGDVWDESEEFEAVKKAIADSKKERSGKHDDEDVASTGEYATPLKYQVIEVTKRMNMTFWRSPNYGFTRFFVHVVIAFLTGVTYWQVGNSAQDLQNRIFAIFQATVLPALIMQQVEPRYDMSRTIFYRESSSKMYSQLAFVVSIVIAEIPYSILCGTAYFIAFYFPAGFNLAADRAGYQYLIIMIDEFFSVTLGQAIAALTPNAFISSLINPFIIILFSLFCGVTIPAPNMPGFWRAWMYQLDPFTRLIGGMMSTELHDLSVTCTPQELAIFNPPSGQTCGDYAGTFLQTAIGYIANPNATEDCGYCQFKLGDGYLSTLGFSWGYRWRDLGIFAAFIGSNLIILAIAARFLYFAKR